MVFSDPARYNPAMRIEFSFGQGRRVAREDLYLSVGVRRVPVRLVRNRRARRYILRLAPDGAARLTLPSGGTIAEALDFARRNTPWLEKQIIRRNARPPGPERWVDGTWILFRGEQVRLQFGLNGQAGSVVFATEAVPVKDPSADLRPELERHLRNLAARELAVRTWELAAQHQASISRVAVRNQRSRWGSCSRHGVISLNWRLIQTPAFVSDYIILHELAHLKHMNHSPAFWREVARLCPDFSRAERWLKQNSDLLRR